MRLRKWLMQTTQQKVAALKHEGDSVTLAGMHSVVAFMMQDIGRHQDRILAAQKAIDVYKKFPDGTDHLLSLAYHSRELLQQQMGVTRTPY